MLVSAGGVYLLVVLVFLLVGGTVVFGGVDLIVDVVFGSSPPGKDGITIDVGMRTVVGG